MSGSIAGLLDQGKSPNIEAALVKDVGTAFEREIPEMARRLLPAQPSLDAHDDVFAETLGACGAACPGVYVARRHARDPARDHRSRAGVAAELYDRAALTAKDAKDAKKSVNRLNRRDAESAEKTGLNRQVVKDAKEETQAAKLKPPSRQEEREPIELLGRTMRREMQEAGLSRLAFSAKEALGCANAIAPSPACGGRLGWGQRAHLHAPSPALPRGLGPQGRESLRCSRGPQEARFR